jgi:tRNA-specific 2-thiouridylase
VHHFTVGQRHGLGLSGREALYVLRLDAAGARVVVGPRASLGFGAARLEQMCWAEGAPPPEGQALRARVQVRHRHRPAWCTVVSANGGAAADVRFDLPEDAVSPGQAAVLYDGEQVLGGGLIASARPFEPAHVTAIGAAAAGEVGAAAAAALPASVRA